MSHFRKKASAISMAAVSDEDKLVKMYDIT